VSHATVSLALRNDPRISPATKRKVFAAARRLGYRPDPHLAELMDLLRR
jgi:LacI family transcriptional regulator